MLTLDDAVWTTFDGAYRRPYDASVPLRAMRDGANVWNALWNELHHQGDVGVASYAAVPQLVMIASAARERDWNFYALIAAIEVQRHRTGNPPMPDWLAADYADAWREAAALARADLALPIDPYTTRSSLSVLALAQGQLKLGGMLVNLDDSEIDEWLDDNLDWSNDFS